MPTPVFSLIIKQYTLWAQTQVPFFFYISRLSTKVSPEMHFCGWKSGRLMRQRPGEFFRKKRLSLKATVFPRCLSLPSRYCAKSSFLFCRNNGEWRGKGEISFLLDFSFLILPLVFAHLITVGWESALKKGTVHFVWMLKLN